MNKSLFLVRHAHRNKDQGEHADNGLSDEGVMQSLSIADDLAPLLGNKQVTLFSSPKKRCAETLEPLAGSLGAHMCLTPALDEQRDDESDTELRQRIDSFLDLVRESSSDAVVACTHGEWVGEFFKLISGEKRELAKGGFVRMEFIAEGRASAGSSPQRSPSYSDDLSSPAR